MGLSFSGGAGGWVSFFSGGAGVGPLGVSPLGWVKDRKLLGETKTKEAAQAIGIVFAPFRNTAVSGFINPAASTEHAKNART